MRLKIHTTAVSAVWLSVVLVTLTAAQTPGRGQSRAEDERQARPQSQSSVPPQSRPLLYQRRDTWYEFLLKQFNPSQLDYGARMEERRRAFLEARLRNPYFGYSLGVTVALVLMTAVTAKLWFDHRRALWVTAEMMADLYNHDLYSRESAREAIRRFNEHIEKCNRAIEANESGYSILDGSAPEADRLRAELQRVGGELTAAKRDNERMQEQLHTKSTLLVEMSLRLEELGRKSGANGERAASDLGRASPDLVKHINGLQEQLYAERQRNRQLKGA